MMNFLDMPDVEPFVIAIWCGSKKPSNLTDYLTPFVNELIELIDDGYRINDRLISIKIRCFVCDTPARCLLKGTQ